MNTNEKNSNSPNPVKPHHTLSKNDHAEDIKRTSSITLLSSDHGRMRRAQRLIEKRDLQAAVKYGTRELCCNPRGLPGWKYKYADVVFITDITSTREITSWATPGAGLDIEKHQISEEMKAKHNDACRLIRQHKNCWTSHTVIVVDQSGSMRKADVEGGATRSDAVWVTMALDYVAKRIQSKESSDTDVVSIVSMESSNPVLVDRKPHDWFLFNSIIDLLRKQEPHFDGDYLPALAAAEKLLLSNTFGSCGLTLFFLSDGKPSDKVHSGKGLSTEEKLLSMIGNRVDSLASRFGRRLSFIAVGFGDNFDEFSLLEKLAERPKSFGSNGRFLAAKLKSESLGNAFSSLSSSIYETRSELSVLGKSSQRTVRDVRRKNLNTIGRDNNPNQNWYIYHGNAWHNERMVYSHKNPRDQMFKPMQPMHPSAIGVALAKEFFGEGAERLVREFREIGPNGRFIGPKMVAKESRFQMDVSKIGQEQIFRFHRTFCNTQERAQGLAKVFNQRLMQLPGYDSKKTPTISFLDCSVYMVNDINLGKMGVLVEKQLDPSKYKKWNDNRGYVDGQESVPRHNLMEENNLFTLKSLDEEE